MNERMKLQIEKAVMEVESVPVEDCDSFFVDPFADSKDTGTDTSG